METGSKNRGGVGSGFLSENPEQRILERLTNNNAMQVTRRVWSMLGVVGK
jgi:hypothetical protein